VTKGNPHPSQEPILRAQLERRDSTIARLMEELGPLRELEVVTRAQHERDCDCTGERCAVGAALVDVQQIRDRLEGARRVHQGAGRF
jgi:hypothetical protein